VSSESSVVRPGVAELELPVLDILPVVTIFRRICSPVPSSISTLLSVLVPKSVCLICLVFLLLHDMSLVHRTAPLFSESQGFAFAPSDLTPASVQPPSSHQSNHHNPTPYTALRATSHLDSRSSFLLCIGCAQLHLHSPVTHTIHSSLRYGPDSTRNHTPSPTI
jgi:hypothetical protein